MREQRRGRGWWDGGEEGGGIVGWLILPFVVISAEQQRIKSTMTGQKVSEGAEEG